MHGPFLDPMFRALLDSPVDARLARRVGPSADAEVALLLRDAPLRLSSKPAIGRGLERLPVSRRVIRRVVAGETPAQALDVLRRLEASGLQTAVTYLGENVTSPK